jgi:hypothetical protein
MLRVSVGGSKSYFVHQDLLPKNAQFFKDKAAKHVDGVIELKNVEPAVFEAYLQWLFFRPLVIRDDEDCAYENVQKHRDQKRGIALYLLGDLLGDAEFRVHVLDLFITKIKTWGVSVGLIEMV